MAEDRRESPGRRRSDRLRWSFHHALQMIAGRENWYRDVWLLIITIVVSWASLTTLDTVDDVQQSRRASTELTCGIGAAVIDAGRATITGGQQGLSPEFTRNLEKLGYPPKKVREEQAKIAAEEYGKFIARRVEDVSGVRGVVRKDGSLDCDRVVALTKVD